MTTTDAAQDAVATAATPPRRENCERCGKGLTGRQERFCSRQCSTKWWDEIHPRLNVVPPDGPRQTSLKVALLNLLSDGAWRTVLDMAADLRSEPHSVSARLSQVRKMGERTGQWVIEADLPDGNATRPHRFRMVSRG